jgi:transposase-like protein
MMSGDDVLIMPAAARVEVFTGRGRRRRWSSDKAQIVEESYSSSVGEAASRYDVSKTQIFTWRRAAEEGGFARIEVANAVGVEAVQQAGVIEICIGGASVRVPPGADPRMVTAVVAALKASR